MGKRWRVRSTMRRGGGLRSTYPSSQLAEIFSNHREDLCFIELLELLIKAAELMVTMCCERER